MKHAVTGLLLFLSTASGQTPPDVQVSLEAGKREVTVAENLQLTVTVISPRLSEDEILRTARARKYEVALPGKTLTVPIITTLRSVESVTQERGGNIIDRWTYTLEPQLPGSGEFPALDVVLRPVSGDPITLHTQPVTFKVVPILPDATSAELRPAAPILKEPGPGWGWSAAILALAAGGAGYWYYRKKAIRPVLDSETREFPQRDRALTEVAAATTLAEASRALWDYLTVRFGFGSGPLTEAEIRQLPGLPEETREELATLGRELDAEMYGPGNGQLSCNLKERLEGLIRRF